MNLGNTHPHTVTELVDLLAESLDRPANKSYIPLPPKGDVLATFADISKAQEVWNSHMQMACMFWLLSVQQMVAPPDFHLVPLAKKVPQQQPGGVMWAALFAIPLLWSIC